MFMQPIRLVPRVITNSSLRSRFSTSAFPVDSKPEAGVPNQEYTSPFQFKKSTHILGYTGLKRYRFVKPHPNAFAKNLDIVKTKWENHSLHSSHITNLVFVSTSLSEMDTALDLVKKYRLTNFPPNPPLSIAVIHSFTHLDRPDLALDALKQPIEFGIYPSGYQLAVLMDVLLKKEQFDLALDAYELLQYVFVPVTELALAVGAFAHVCEGSAALLLEARELLLKLGEYEWKFTTEAWKIALGLLKRQNRIVEMNALIREFKHYEIFTSDDALREFEIS